MTKKFFHQAMTLAYLLLAAVAASQTVRHVDREMSCIDQAYDLDSFANTVSPELGDFFSKLSRQIVAAHPIIGPAFAAKMSGLLPAINQRFHLLPAKEAKKQLDEIPGLVKQAAGERKSAYAWSCLLLGLSLVYVFGAYLVGEEARLRRLAFCLALVSGVFFVVGFLAPAMVVVVMFPKSAGISPFVLHHETRSIVGVILELYSTQHWAVAVCLTVFSFLVPVTKFVLTLVSIGSSSPARSSSIENFLSLIGKWSMVDVFVAAVILAHFAIQSDQATQAYLVLGLYYFLGYCLLSMVTTTLLTKEMKAEAPLGAA